MSEPRDLDFFVSGSLFLGLRILIFGRRIFIFCLQTLLNFRIPYFWASESLFLGLRIFIFGLPSLILWIPESLSLGPRILIFGPPYRYCWTSGSLIIAGPPDPYFRFSGFFIFEFPNHHFWAPRTPE